MGGPGEPKILPKHVGADGCTFPIRNTLVRTVFWLAKGRRGAMSGEGGDFEGARTHVKLFDPTRGTWSSTDAMADARVNHTLTVLPNGQVLVAGGIGKSGFRSSDILASVEAYDPLTGTWSSTGE